jgi:glycosyltransferase involved in cell wall biosynthesis
LFELFNFNEYDLVISSSTRFAKSVVTQPHTLHIAYINSPPRFLWPVSMNFSPQNYLRSFENNVPALLRPLMRLFLRPILSLLRMHDYAAVQRIDYVIGNSRNVAWRIEKFYRRPASHLYPFVDLERFTQHEEISSETKDYFLIVSRITEHKRIDLAIEAFNELGWPLKIIGSGPALNHLKQKASSNIEFLGYLSDQEVAKYVHGCRAFLYPQEEDFGITALEAQAAGKPVIAFRAGGATETVKDQLSGLFFYPQTKEALIEALQRFDPASFDPEKIKQHAQFFSKERFQKELKDFVQDKLKHNATNQEVAD